MSAIERLFKICGDRQDCKDFIWKIFDYSGPKGKIFHRDSTIFIQGDDDLDLHKPLDLTDPHLASSFMAALHEELEKDRRNIHVVHI